MPSPDCITVAQLSHLIGTPDAPLIIDVRIDEDRAADPRLMLASVQRDYRTVPDWAANSAVDWAGRPLTGPAGRSWRCASTA